MLLLPLYELGLAGHVSTCRDDGPKPTYMWQLFYDLHIETGNFHCYSLPCVSYTAVAGIHESTDKQLSNEG